MKLASLLCCPACASSIDLDQREGNAVRCQCGRALAVEEEILCLLKQEALTGEGARECQLRDEQASTKTRRSAKEIGNDVDQLMELRPTLKWLGLGTNDTILELGCGNGRYTEVIASPGRRIVAVDFSKAALRQLARVLRERSQLDSVGLVLADITDFKVKPRSFDVVFSTLTSNLPTSEARQALYRLAAQALKPGGRFVFSTHYQGWRERYHRVPQSGHYDGDGIYRYNFGMGELRKEIDETFRKCRMTPIKVYLPFLSRYASLRLPLSQIVQHIPLANQFGKLLLCEASDPWS